MAAEPKPDRIDALVGQWKSERPDLDLDVMALAARVMRAGQLIDDRVSTGASGYGLSKAEGDVLFTLRRAGEPYRLSPSQLSQSLLVATGTMTSRLDRLEERGLIKRIPSKTDRRSLDVALMPEARKLVDEAVTRHVDNEERMLSALTKAERADLEHILRKLIAHLEGDQDAG
jgi:DNA-binding MarR family transcriptional regulator